MIVAADESRMRRDFARGVLGNQRLAMAASIEAMLRQAIGPDKLPRARIFCTLSLLQLSPVRRITCVAGLWLT